MTVARARFTTARLEAELYALTHRGNAGDAAFYARICVGAASVLELGTGYGRLIPKLARSRRQLVGLELDSELLAAASRNVRLLPLATQRSVRLVQGDMRHFDLGRRFERVLLPYNALYCLLTRRDALACFRAVRSALEPGGVFALDVWNAEAFHADRPARSTVDDVDPIVTLDHAGRTWDVFEHSRVRRATQRLDVTYRYVPRRSGAACRISIAQRYYRAAEIRDLLERTGFAVQKRYGDFSGAHFTARARHLVVLASAV
jgi:SAM-dependent methyltransferase